MRWAVIGAVGIDSFEFHLHDTLDNLGHEVRVFDLKFGIYKPRTTHFWLRRAFGEYDRLMGVRLARAIAQFEPDIVLAVYRYIHPVTIELLKQMAPGVPVIHVNQDNLCTLEQQQVLASPYDALFVKDPYMVRTFRDKAGLNAHYLPESFNPRYHKPPPVDRAKNEMELDIDILVFGTLYPYRNRFIEKLLERRKRIKVYGTAGPFMSKVVEQHFSGHQILTKEKSDLIYGSRIVLNNFFYGEIEGVNCKYFEIHGSGGFQICDYKDALVEYSPVDPARYTFNSVQEALDIIDYFLPRQEERYAIANTHWQHFLAHHTYEHRIATILKTLNLT